MQIISFDYEPSSKRGGQELGLFEVITGLKRKNHQIELGYVEYGDLVEKYKDIGVDVKKIGSICVQNKLSLKEYKDFFVAPKAFSDPKNSVLFINQIKDAPLAGLIKLLYGSKIVCHMRLPPVGITAQVKWVIPHIAKFIVATQHVYDLYVKAGIPANKIHIIPDGFWMDEIKLPQRKQQYDIFSIAYIGRIDYVKGIHVLIEAMHRLTQKGIRFRLDIAGHPLDHWQEDYLAGLKKDILKYGLENNVFFIGHTSNPIEHLSKYDLCVFPSIWDEPFGRVILESILAGTPIIGNDVGSVAEIMNDNAKQWVYHSVEEMVEKIVKIYNDPSSFDLEERRSYISKKYNLGEIVPQIESILL